MTSKTHPGQAGTKKNACRCLRIAVVVTSDVARLASNLPARLWLGWNLTSQMTSRNFMRFFRDSHSFVTSIAWSHQVSAISRNSEILIADN